MVILVLGVGQYLRTSCPRIAFCVSPLLLYSYTYSIHSEYKQTFSTKVRQLLAYLIIWKYRNDRKTLCLGKKFISHLNTNLCGFCTKVDDSFVLKHLISIHKTSYMLVFKRNVLLFVFQVALLLMPHLMSHSYQLCEKCASHQVLWKRLNTYQL